MVRRPVVQAQAESSSTNRANEGEVKALAARDRSAFQARPSLFMTGDVFARFLHDGSEVKREEIGPEQQAFNTRLGGLPAGTLTLEVPVQKPDVLVPVIELFLRR